MNASRERVPDGARRQTGEYYGHQSYSHWEGGEVVAVTDWVQAGHELVERLRMVDGTHVA